ncbi:hypothetical protein GLAREA_01146 [Glarea lozoyensis ATCC 20868]|uniref:CorA-like transporter domain-containing protein n=2 Tax=Glarea lozoyensis TaxID=101852 RepID=S3DDB9_GLAL2|nr:uncharacterized protein GLAREA_01146 [Glarea lozoyensis ATCC 20868]EPE29986.1 hypothetical protein GLAREA_01146 [Glarea lozoyensis ATCC 20868]
MAVLADQQLFERSCQDTAKFPQNLVYPDTYDHLLVSYLERLQKEESRLFHDEPKAEVSIRDFDDSSRVFENITVRSHIELKDYICGEKLFIHAKFSRDKLKVTREMLMFLFTYHQIMPVFLDFLFPFGKQHYAKEMNFSGFHFESRLSLHDESLKLLHLGRSGRDYRMCYNLKAVEPSPSQEEWPWSIRQTATYHCFDVETGKALWICIKGDQLMKKRVEASTKTKGSQNMSRFDTRISAFSSSIATHLLLFDWCREHWRWYIAFLEESLQKSTRDTLLLFEKPRTNTHVSIQREDTQRTLIAKPSRRHSSILKRKPPVLPAPRPIELPKYTPTEKLLPPPIPEPISSSAPQEPLEEDGEFSFGDLKRVQHLEEKANEMLQILDSNIAVLSEIKEHYQILISSSDFPAEIREGCARDIAKFERTTSSVINELRKQQSGTSSLLNLLKERKSLLYGILQFKNMESNKLFASRAQLSTANMETMTESMHQIAIKTKKETVSMRIITLVTLFFLPGTFISTIMSTDIVQYKISDNGKSQEIFQLGALQLYLAITLPLMFITFASWYGVYYWVDWKEKAKERVKRMRGGV